MPDTPDLFAPPRPAHRPAPANHAHEGCGRSGCIAFQGKDIGGICFLSDEAFQAYLVDCSRAVEAAEVREMERWTPLRVEHWLGRVLIKRGTLAANRLQAALAIARQRKGNP